jgi:NADH:ubiquinone oxidoreductase subunit 2 (subunit N)
MFILTILRLGGLPPFLGFISKLFAIQTIFLMCLYFVTVILVTGSLVSLFYYVRVTYSSLLINSQSIFMCPHTKNEFSKTLATITIGGNLIGPLLVYII